ncbi:hypothetical protein [Catelliglobosispora koreensis]|uniref:hypothetical protein n=1 Tax=Catelliglobosispora koreensis TaxID=129052 RepID=UPI0003803A7B|nr:hypothetical protein [Catelliglobosispora koreensis]
MTSSLRTFIPLLVLTVAGVLTAVASPAQALPCSPWESEAEMLATPASCRGTWIAEPGRFNLMQREQLLRGNLYGNHGFSRQWRWYAPEEQVTITDPGQQWAYCFEGSPFDEFCPDSRIRTSNNGMLNSFIPDQITLSTFSFKGRHVARACGNFFTTGGPHEDPVPRLTVEKFEDRNRNGARDPGEEGVSGWQFRIHRDSSRYGDQGLGHVDTVATGSDGRVQLLFQDKGPGLYRIEEVARDGWAPTTAAVQHVVVDPGIGDRDLGTLRFGNAQTRADLVKVDFSLVDPPQRLEAGQSTELVVRAHIRNDGPADATAIDSIDVIVPADCTASPQHAEVTRALARGESAVIDFRMTVTCTQPSFHPMVFTDHLRVVTPGVEDPDPSDNTVGFEHVFPVFDQADITLANTQVSCPQRSDVGAEFTCTATAVIGNAGPYGPAAVQVTFGLTGMQDCSRDSGGTDRQRVSVATGTPVTVTAVWRVVCEQRSYHDFLVLANAELDHLHVEDPVGGNSDGSAPVRVEIFEPADMSVSGLDIRCTERESSTQASQCTAVVTVANAGPATDVELMGTLVITPEPGCTATPAPAVEQNMTLAAGQQQTMTATWNLTCTSADRHAVRVTASVRATEPHAEDPDVSNNTTTAIWGPGDIKPRSLPSSINIGKDGVVPFALLSTATLDMLSAIDRSSLTFGVTGTEQSVIGCASQGEDVNGDGRMDLICRANTQLLGLTCDTTVLRVIGLTADGVRFYSEDAVKVVGCH